MNARQLAQVALGILGVWALLDAVNAFMVFASAMNESGGTPGSVMLVVGLPALMLLGLSYVLVFHNAQLAAALAPAADTGAQAATPDIARLLVALLGVMLVLQTLPRGVNLIMNFFTTAADPDFIQGGALRRALVGTGLEFACALYLILRPERFIGFLNRPRSAPAEVAA